MMRKMKFIVCAMLMATAMQAQQPTPRTQMEKLDRGVVAVRPSWTNYVSWRLLGTDPENVTFDLYRDGNLVKENISETFAMDGGTANSKYKVVAKENGRVIDESKEAETWNKHKSLQLQRPAAGKTKPYSTTINSESVSYPDGQEYTYTPNDMSVGDVDGDGEYELFVKWDPSNSKDNSQNGVTGNVFIDCYKLDGTQLWRIDLGKNIRAGAHYTQFMVYDFDNDGKADLMCKTAPGSLDGKGNYVNQAATDDKIKAASNTKDWVSEGAGRINGGQEYLTVFNGLTGAAIHTIAYNPNRNAKSELSEAAGSFNWAVGKTDAGSYGNRGERYLAAVAYLDGTEEPASAVFCRGYYSYAFLWAVSFDGQQLHQRWLHRSDNTNGSTYTLVTYDMEGKSSSQTFTGCKPTSGSGSGTMYANGNHNLSVADVDGDGCDEIIWGAGAVDHNGKLLYGTGFGHGDAIHLGDLDPDRPGLELFDVHEEKGTYSWDVHDAATGEILLKGGQSGQDNGRGVAADIVATSHGYEFWSAYGGFDSESRNQNPFNVQTKAAVGSKSPSMNFRIYWDGDVQDELLDGINVTKYNPTGSATNLSSSWGGNPASCNSTKSTPCLMADILGDWREEVILWDSSDPSKINIYTTATKTDYRIPTLMHDHTYRMGVCWQNVAYNQPPHLGYYLPDYVAGKIKIVETGIEDIKHQTIADNAYYNLQGQRIEKPHRGIYIVNGKKRIAR